MAISTSNVTFNDRAIAWQYTGDGATTAATATFAQKLDPSIALDHVLLITAPTAFDYPSFAGGLLYPSAGTRATVASSSINATTGVVTITASAAVANGTVAYCVAVLNHEAN
jgi:hypothetical protein